MINATEIFCDFHITAIQNYKMYMYIGIAGWCCGAISDIGYI
jgi:hypothetical protein